MSYSRVTYTGNGSNRQFDVAFADNNASVEFLEQNDIHVYVNGVEDTTFTWVTATRIQTTSTPANGASVLIERQTDAGEPEVVLNDGSNPTAADFNTALAQALFLAQEALDKTSTSITLAGDSTWDAANYKIKNLAPGTNSNDAVTLGQAQSLLATGSTISIPDPAAGTDTGKVLQAKSTGDGYELGPVLGDLAALDSVGSGQIDNLAVTTGKLAANAVDSTKLADGAVSTAAKIADAIITAAKCATGFLNNLLPSQTGNSGKFLTTNGSGTLSWAAASSPFTLAHTGSGHTATSGGTHTATHNFGSEPKLIMAHLVCNDAGGDGGYAQNDVIIVPITTDARSTVNHGATAFVTNTTTNIRYGDDTNVWRVIGKSSGGPVNLTNSKWTVYIKTYG